MRIKGSLAKGFLIALAFSLIPATAISAQKITTGSKCMVFKQKVKFQNKTYTCTKSGKKLVWNKGVSIKATPSPTPTESPEPIKIQPVQISIDNLDRNIVPQIAYDNVIKALNSRSRAPYRPSIFVGPNVNQVRVDQETNGLARAIDLWAPYFQPEKFQAVYAVSGDEEWLEKKSSELELGFKVGFLTDKMKMDVPCGFAYAFGARQIPTFLQCLGRPYSGANKQTGPHEYTHLFQLSYGGASAEKLPWYLEGSASYFGWTLGFHPYNPNSTERAYLLGNYYWEMRADAKSDLRSKDLQRFKSRMKSLVPSGDQSIATSSYWVGGLATEVLIALYGFDKFVEFTRNIQTNSNMSSLLMQTYGFDEDYFYEKLAPYIWAH